MRYLDILKDNKNQYISRNKIEYDNIKNGVKNLTDDVGKIKQKNKILLYKSYSSVT